MPENIKKSFFVNITQPYVQYTCTPHSHMNFQPITPHQIQPVLHQEAIQTLIFIEN